MKKLVLTAALAFGVVGAAQANDFPEVCNEYFKLAEEWTLKQGLPAEVAKQATEQVKTQFAAVDKAQQSEACEMALKEIKAQLK